MKQYYIHIENEQIGPLNFDELKAKNIKRDTMVWYEGLADWQKAGDVEELQSLFKAVPPPINKTVPTPPILNNQINYTPTQNLEYEEPTRIFGIRKNIFISGVLGLAFVICIFSFSSYNQKDEIEKIQQKEQLEEYDQQLKDQEAELAAQNKRIAEQEKLEKERIERERKAAIEKRINEITGQLTIAYTNLENAKRNLHDVSAFKLLRSSGERHEQVSAAEQVVETWKNEIATLEAEIQKLQAEY
ncbi:GYF domain-containing protein [Flavobacterium sp. DGU11]|uniref:GYF domain-containing protein n=1 Tax=Flavobacterium arundinis TaxID=3139143 RepID=A0ABU9HT26_9FLAO